MCKSTNRHNAKPAFTLVELLVSIGLLALLTFGVASLFPRGVGLVQRASSITAAASLAQAQLEIILTQPYESVSTGSYEARHFVTGAFERQTVVSYVDPTTLATSSSNLGLKRVEVTVYYPSTFGEKTIIISTLIPEK